MSFEFDSISSVCKYPEAFIAVINEHSGEQCGSLNVVGLHKLIGVAVLEGMALLK